MSDGGHHHGGDMGGQPGFQPGMFPPHETHHHHHHVADASDRLGDLSGQMPPAFGRRGNGVRRYGTGRVRPRVGSPAWVGLWVVRLAVLAFIAFVAFQVLHGVTSTSSP
jgi:hypothetical protein